MAKASVSTKETANYARLCRLLVDVGSEVLRDTFDRLRPKGSLDKVLKTPLVIHKLTSLRKRRVLNQAQWAIINSSPVSSKQFDISLLAVFLRNICGLSTPASGWNTLPHAANNTEAADIARITIHRNEVFAHAKQASVDDVQFELHWKNIKEALVRLGGTTYEVTIDRLKTEGIDPEKEQYYQKLLKEWKENEESVMEELGEIKGRLGSIDCQIQKLDEKLDFAMPVALSAEDFDVQEYRVRLEKLYNNLNQVNITPWDPENTVHIDEIYTKLFWVRNKRKPSGKKEEKLNDYSDVLREQKSNPYSNRFLVYGIPGIGKSTFAKKIALDWARSKKEILKKFDVLLMIPLRNVCGCSTFRDILIEAKLFSTEDQRFIDGLNRYILDHQDKVLLVLDGFDEYSASGKSPVVQRIWMGDELRECFVILTTRPVKEDDTKRFSHSQFQIKGFDWARIKEFAMKILEDEKNVEMFLNYIKKHTLIEIAEIPLLLLMLCLVWKEKDREVLPEAKVHLYKEFIQTLINHMAAKDNERKFERIDDYKGDLEKVGELAFKALLRNSLEFDYEHLPMELLSSKLITVGVIQIVKLFSAKPKKKVAFLHKSIQEFLAAWFIIHRLIPFSNDDVSCMPAIDSTRKVVDFLEVLKFVCEWSPEGSRAVLQQLEYLRKSQNPSGDDISGTLFLEDLPDDDKKLLKLSLECFLKTSNESKAAVYPSLLKSVSGVLVIPDTLLPRVADGHIVESNALPNCVLFDFQRHPSLKDRDYMASIMDDLNSVIVIASEEGKASDFVRRQTKVEVLASLFLKCKKNEMCLHFSQISSVVIGALNEVTPKSMGTIHQTHTDHKKTQGSDEATEDERRARQHCFSLAKKIDIDEIHGDMTISHVMPLLARPREIALQSLHESSKPQEIECLVSGISITECLQRLRLHKICLTAQLLPILTDGFHEASNLQELYLSENPLGSSIRCLADNLHHVQNLTVLELSNVLMDERAFSDLANSLCHVPNLKVLSVSRNQLRTSISELADNLGYIPLLTDLELSNTQMDEEGARALANNLQVLSKLENLDISHNPLGGAVVVIAENLYRATCLTELNMTDTKMGAEEITALISSLRSFQNLRILSVGYNPLAQGVRDLVENLYKISKLKRLNLENVEMGEEQVDCVKSAWKRNQSLAIANDYFDGKGETKKGRSVEVLPVYYSHYKPASLGDFDDHDDYDPNCDGFDDYEPPDYDDREPDYDECEPDYNDYEPDYGDCEPDYDDREPDYDDCEPDYDDREPDYDDCEPDYDDREPDYDDCEADYGDCEADFDDREPDYGDCEPDHGDCEPDYDDCEPNYDDREPDYDDCEPDYDDREPDYDGCEADYGDCEPDYDDREPDYGDCKPDHGDCQPDYDDCQPNYGDCEPEYDDYELDYGDCEPDYDDYEPDYGNCEPDYDDCEPDYDDYRPSNDDYDAYD